MNTACRRLLTCVTMSLLLDTTGIAVAADPNVPAGSEGSTNTSYGRSALYKNIRGILNTAIGKGALYSNTIGHSNTAIGAEALYRNKSGYQNTAIGNLALYKTSGGWNTAVGYSAMYSNTKGRYNTALGGYAGFKNVRGNKNVFVGSKAGYVEKGSNKLYISNSETKKPLIYGEFNTKILKVNGKMYATRYITSSDVRLKRDIQPLSGTLASVMKLQGTTYRLKEGTTDTPTIDIGLIAQDVEKIFPQLVTEDERNYKGVDYSKLTVVLIEAMKEQQGQITALEQENTQLKTVMAKQMEALLARVAMLEGESLAAN